MTGARKDVPALIAALAVIASALVVWSREPTMAADKPPADVVMYLQKISRTDRTPYHARQLVVYMGRPQSAAVLDIRSSPRAMFVRSDAGDDVVRLWRRPGIGVVAARNGAVTDDALDPSALRAADVVEKYEVTMGPAEKMLGVDVVPLTLVRRSDQLMVERLWVNPASGVVYRRELFGPTGHLVGLSTIIDMRWGEKATAERYDPDAVPATHALVTTDAGAPRTLPYGYRLSHAYRLGVGGRATLQWVYSDGLHALSVFATKGPLRPPRDFDVAHVAGARAFVGPGPATWAWEGAGRTWVLVAEEPDLDPSTILVHFPRGTPSVWARMGSLWSRAFAVVGRIF